MVAADVHIIVVNFLARAVGGIIKLAPHLCLRFVGVGVLAGILKSSGFVVERLMKVLRRKIVLHSLCVIF